MCTSSTSEDGLIRGNLKIAEDRILSYLLVLGTSKDRGEEELFPDAYAPFASTPSGSRLDRVWETHWVSAN